MMAKSRLTANEIRVPMKVNRRTRTGIAYQRGGRGVGMLSGYHHLVVRGVGPAPRSGLKKTQIDLTKISGINELRVGDLG
jgi:hypothetical protein